MEVDPDRVTPQLVEVLVGPRRLRAGGTSQFSVSTSARRPVRPDWRALPSSAATSAQPTPRRCQASSTNTAIPGADPVVGVHAAQADAAAGGPCTIHTLGCVGGPGQVLGDIRHAIGDAVEAPETAQGRALAQHRHDGSGIDAFKGGDTQRCSGRKPGGESRCLEVDIAGAGDPMFRSGGAEAVGPG